MPTFIYFFKIFLVICLFVFDFGSLGPPYVAVMDCKCAMCQ